ncbi:MAG: permease [Omnitrophica WOR_2 bacterium SM23_29]|nr:MAG: permease [Omnitrophica WOR_2 bacterium SM23_29]
MINILAYLALGLLAGILSGLIGIGGGMILIPVLVFIFGFTQLQAQGTTLALMVPPIGILAALIYYSHGHVNLKVAAFICLGFFFGGLFGARVATGLPNIILQRIFGVALFLVSLRMIFGR